MFRKCKPSASARRLFACELSRGKYRIYSLQQGVRHRCAAYICCCPTSRSWRLETRESLQRSSHLIVNVVDKHANKQFQNAVNLRELMILSRSRKQTWEILSYNPPMFRCSMISWMAFILHSNLCWSDCGIKWASQHTLIQMYVFFPLDVKQQKIKSHLAFQKPFATCLQRRGQVALSVMKLCQTH